MRTSIDRGTAVRVVGSIGATWWLRGQLPWRPDDPVLVLVAWHQPTLYTTLHIVHAALLVTTPYLAWSVVWSARTRQPLGEM